MYWICTLLMFPAIIYRKTEEPQTWHNFSRISLFRKPTFIANTLACCRYVEVYPIHNFAITYLGIDKHADLGETFLDFTVIYDKPGFSCFPARRPVFSTPAIFSYVYGYPRSFRLNTDDHLVYLSLSSVLTLFLSLLFSVTQPCFPWCIDAFMIIRVGFWFFGALLRALCTERISFKRRIYAAMV
jgi:hypothetical protein